MSMIVTGCVGAALSVGSSIFGASSASKARRRAESEKRKQLAKLDQLEKNRQAIPNPYENVKDLSGIAKDLSSMVSNPFANLGVATQAAKMQAEESNISLANTLDTLRATGASAGGATALAQAALQSKQGVSASIEKQEADNEKLKAQGEADKQAKKMEEAQRLQQAKYMEGVRTQEAETEGIKFKYGEQESRDIAKLNRLAGQEAQAKQNEAAAKQAKGAAIGGAISAVGSLAGGFMGGGK